MVPAADRPSGARARADGTGEGRTVKKLPATFIVQVRHAYLQQQLQVMCCCDGGAVVKHGKLDAPDTGPNKEQAEG